ncbi:unnamed protein product [Mycena citricolor]|uniref:Anaphase-promoting complex subunit 5 n=1 Tax=Mycena citricolor TaxID=2018698 RepID=A0AAD2HJ95_9AGAR|nr:unnamed protein product [Mycena citricolor]
MQPSPRPFKRIRVTPPGDTTYTVHAAVPRLSGSQLLLALPSVLVHPPTHTAHKRTLYLSLLSLRRCLCLPNPGGIRRGDGSAAWDLSQTDECRAWCALAEIGLIVLEGGFGDEPWASGIESEIDKALGKASLIASKHPTLSAFPQHLSLLSARAAPHRARQLLKPVPTAFIVGGTLAFYYAHLSWSDHLLQGLIHNAAAPIARDIVALRTALSPLLTAPHINIVHLARLIELRALIALGRWDEVGPALERAETSMGIAFAAPPAPPGLHTTSAFHAALVVHLLILGIVWLSYSAGGTAQTSARLTLLYTVLDAGVYNGKHRQADIDGRLGLESEGVLEVPLDPTLPPLYIKSTHPRVLYALGYLISAVARRDLVGRKPKRKTFVLEGLGVVDREACKELRVPRWASASDVRAIELQMAKIKADLMCELVAVSIMRSEFDEAERTLNNVIAHARTYNLFSGALAPRITLLHGQLAHALGRHARARQCYRVSAALAQEAGDVEGNIAARVGEVALLIGLQETNSELEQLGHEVAAACGGLSGAMRAIGEVIEGVLTSEILKAKQHLKNALNYATESQDNHLRALILALIAAHYLHTAGDQAQMMLGTCEQLAAGLGAPTRKGNEQPDALGNAPLRLWVGERFLELYRRDGQTEAIAKREETNALLRRAVASLFARER